MAGNGTPNPNSATKDSAAIACSTRFFKARAPIRQAAKTTMATTAGLMPSKIPFTAGTSPNAR